LTEIGIYASINSKMSKPSFQFVKPYSKGQITIPLEFRKYLDIDEDTWLHLTIEDGKIVIEPVEKEKPRETGYKTVEERSPAVDQKKYKTMIKEAKGSYGEKIVEENERVRKEIEERLEKLDL
jgi:AbrB family looped-hinge helix DNA binding protein